MTHECEPGYLNWYNNASQVRPILTAEDTTLKAWPNTISLPIDPTQWPDMQLGGQTAHIDKHLIDYTGERLPDVNCPACQRYFPDGVKVAQAVLQAKVEAGTKYDKDKLRYDLIPPEALHALATVLTYGCEKYGDRNWEKGMTWGRVFGALMRHLWAWWSREDRDRETGHSHLWHALTCLVFLITFEQRSVGTDDRVRREQG